MYELLLNRCTGHSFIRWMATRSFVIRDHPGTPDRADMKLILTEFEFMVFRAFLIHFPDRCENPEGILKGLGQLCSVG